jgi:hypothetical protein
MPGVTKERGRTSLLAINYILLDLSKEESSRAYFISPVPFGTGQILEKATLQYTPGKAQVNQKNHCANRNYPGEVIADMRCGPSSVLLDRLV